MDQPTRRKQLKFKRKQCMNTLSLKEGPKNLNLFSVTWRRACKFNIILIKVFTKKMNSWQIIS
jgi:hypothetical protein